MDCSQFVSTIIYKIERQKYYVHYVCAYAACKASPSDIYHHHHSRDPRLCGTKIGEVPGDVGSGVVPN